MSSSTSGTVPVTSRVLKPASCKPEVNQTTCFAGPPTFNRAIMRTIFVILLTHKTSIIHAESRFTIILMTNLVNFFFPPSAGVQPVRTVDHDPVDIPNVPVSMHDASRYQHSRGIVLAHDHRHHRSKRLRVFP